MRRARRASILGAVSLAAFVAAPARAGDGVCGDPRGAAGGPLAGGTDAADFGAIPEACGGDDVALRLRGSALVASDKPDFFGAVVGTSTLRLRHRLGGGARTTTWLSFAADIVTYRYVVNGPTPSHGLGFGPQTLGVHRALADGPAGAATVYARALLPLDTARQSGVRTGLELGATGRRALGASGRAGVQGGAGVLAPLIVVGGQSHGALEAVALGEVWLAPGPRLALSAGASARAELSPDPTFVTLAPRAAVRLALRHGLSAAMLVEVPAAGADRTDLVAGLYVAWAAAD